MKSSLPVELVKQDLAINKTWGLRIVELHSKLRDSGIALVTTDLQESLTIGMFEPDYFGERKSFNNTLKEFSGYYYDEATFKAERDSLVKADFTDDKKIAQCLIKCIFTVFYTGDKSTYTPVINKLKTFPAQAWVFHKNELKEAFFSELQEYVKSVIVGASQYQRDVTFRKTDDAITKEYSAAIVEANAVIEEICEAAKKELDCKQTGVDVVPAKKHAESNGGAKLKR